MAFWESIVSGNIGDAFKGFGSMAKELRVAFTGDDPLTAEQKARLNEQLTAMEAVAQKAAVDFDTAQMSGQIELNKIEAQSDSLFKSGWRPAVGWICVSGLFVTFILKPLLPWVCQVAAMTVGAQSTIPPIPDIPMGDLIVLLLGMLGLGGMRSFDKLQQRRSVING